MQSKTRNNLHPELSWILSAPLRSIPSDPTSNTLSKEGRLDGFEYSCNQGNPWKVGGGEGGKVVAVDGGGGEGGEYFPPTGGESVREEGGGEGFVWVVAR